MTRLVEFLSRSDSVPRSPGPPIAGISPHDDYLYAGRVTYPLFASLQVKEAVIFGVTHGTVRKEIGDPRGVAILDSFPTWNGVREECPPSPLRAILAERLPAEMRLISNRAHVLEHSIEALIPFLQHASPGVRITPIMITAMPLSRMQAVSDTLASLIHRYILERRLVPGRDIVFLISSDANHYGPDFANAPFGADAGAHAEGTATDRKIVQECLVGPLTEERIASLTRQLWGKDDASPPLTLWCGKYSVPFGLLTVRRVIEKWNGGVLTGTLLRYSDTYTEGVLPLTETGMGLTAPFSLKHWVGFFSMAFTLQK
jgi:AmmeMemoRadiSam system protein B